MSATPKADAFVEMLRPLATDGNEFAVVAWCRVASADDPEAETDRIIVEYAAMANRAIDLIRPLMRLWYDTTGPN